MKRGISLITLIITIVTIIILASISIIGSLDTTNDAHIAKNEEEFNNVCSYVRAVSAKLNADMIDVTPSGDMLATDEQINEFAITGGNSEITSGDIAKIRAMNASVPSSRAAKYGYYYVTGSQIENGIPGVDIASNITNVHNDYIINFYYGVVIGKISDTKVNVMGAVK